MAQGRSILKQIFQNFAESLKLTSWGRFQGKDYYGTEYYEGPKGAQRQRPSRWFVPKDKNFDQEIPPEWEAWLRHRRNDPPTEEEIQFNILKMQKTLENARKLEGSEDKDKEELKTFEKPLFPVYKDYEDCQVDDSKQDDLKK